MGIFSRLAALIQDTAEQNTVVVGEGDAEKPPGKDSGIADPQVHDRVAATISLPPGPSTTPQPAVGEEQIILGRTGLKNKVLSFLGSEELLRFTLPDGRLALLQKFDMTMGSYILGGQYNFVLRVGEIDKPESVWIYKFNFENDTGALALDRSLRTRRWQAGESTPDTKTASESMADIEAAIDSLPAA